MQLSSLGVVSYGFYLFHQPVIELTNVASRNLFSETLVHPLIKYALCLGWYPLILVLSLATFRWVEQPSIALGKAVWERINKAKKAIPAAAISTVIR